MSTRNASLESLESRLHLSVTVSSAGSALLVSGDGHIALSQNAGNLVVTGLDGTEVNVRARNLALANAALKVKMGSGDDIVEIASPISVASFSFNGGAGNNQFINAGNVNATGSIMIDGQDATAANGQFGLAESSAEMATGSVYFDQKPAEGADGSVTLLGITAQNASGSITITDAKFNGQGARGSVSFDTNVVAGNTVRISDGTHPAMTYTAVAADADGSLNQFLVGADSVASIQNLIAAINADTSATFTIFAQQDLVIARTANIINTAAGSNGNGGLSAVGSAIRVVNMKDGANPVAVGDSVTISDGIHPARTFTIAAVIDATHTAANGFYLIGADAHGTLANLAAAITAANTPATPLDIIPSFTDNNTLRLDNSTILSDTVKGTAGNQPIQLNAQAEAWSVVGMKEGTDTFVPGDFITLDDGIHPAQKYTAVSQVTWDAMSGEEQQDARESGSFVIRGDAYSTLQDLSFSIDAVHNVRDGEGHPTKSFIIVSGISSDGEGGPASIAFRVYDGDLVGPFAGMAELANTTTFLTDASGQWVNKEQLGRDANGALWPASEGGQADPRVGQNAVVASVGDKITLDDGLHAPVTFTAVAATATPGPNEFRIAFTEAAQAASFAAAVDATSGLNITATADTPVDENYDQSGGGVTLINTLVGKVGNSTASAPRITIQMAAADDEVTTEWPSVFTESGRISAHDFTGGSDREQTIKVGDWIIIGDGGTQPIVFTAIAGTPVAGTPTFQIGADTAATRDNLINAINGFNNGGLTLTVIAGRAADSHTDITLVNTVVGEAGNFFDSSISSWQAFTGDADLFDGHNAVNISAGATVTLNDGATTVVLTAVTAQQAVLGANEFRVGASKAETAANLAAAINGLTGFNITADAQEDGKILLTNDAPGVLGNQEVLVVDAVSHNINATDLTGGSSGALTTAKDLTMTVLGYGDNDLQLTGATVGRALKIQGGSGVDAVSLNAVSVTGATRILMGAGEDALLIDASTFTGTFYTSGGSGDDLLAIDSQGQTGTKFGSTSWFLTGGGQDVLSDSTATSYTTKSSTGKKVKVFFSGAKDDGALLNDSGVILGTVNGGKPTYKEVNGTLA